MISIILYYLIFTSSVFIYGIGINKATLISESPKHIFLNIVKMVITVSSSSVLTYLLTEWLLVKVNLVELYPFLAVLIFSSLSVFVESVIRITAKTNTAEFAVSVLCVILSVNESSTILESLVISIACSLSFYLSVPFIFSIKKRIEISRPSDFFENSSLIFISIAVIIISFLAWNVSWLNMGVNK
ncbi:MAG: hypothetical protein WCQ67_00905 [Treponema sp.]